MGLTKLLEPFDLKTLRLRNRIVMAPMLSRLCNLHGTVSPKLIDYYAERAKGGVGLIITEYCYIDERESKANHGQLGVYGDQLIAGLGDLAEAIQEWGAKVILQMCHAGRNSSMKFTGRQPIAPSSMLNHRGEWARAMTLEEIETTIESFTEAACRAKTAGFDGIELHGAHGYLMAQFLSPFTNHRADLYGKDRGLFALKTLDRIRSKVGGDYLVGYRISAEEFIEGGVTLEEAKSLAKKLEGKGIDYIHVSAGVNETGQHYVTPNYLPRGYLLHLAEGIKSVVKVPVIAVGAIHDPQLADETLRKKRADLIAMGRALIADPGLPNKIKSGRFEDICSCLRCNDGCSIRLRPGRAIRCSVNSEVGRERQMKIHSALKAKHVCIIGGGPAGMEAARVLALRKHRVTLIEKEEELGGLLKYAAIPDFKAELKSFLNYLRKQIEKLNVEILYNQPATPEFVLGLKPEAIVLATGSTLHIPDIPSVSNPKVISALDILGGKFHAGKKVLVVGGAAMGCEVAAHLASLDKKIIIVEMLNDLAMDLDPRSRTVLLQLLRERGVEILTNWKFEKLYEGGILLVNRDWKKLEVAADTVVLATGLVPNKELLIPLKEGFSEVYAIGDCVEPRKIYQAIHDGAFVGRVI